MGGFPVYVEIAVWGAPFWLSAIVALGHAARAPRPRRPGRWFRNRPAFLGMTLPLISSAFVAAAFAFFGVLGCDGGMIDPISCRHAPDSLGRGLYGFGFKGLLVTEVVGLPSLVLCALAEVATRVRLSRGR